MERLFRLIYFTGTLLGVLLAGSSSAWAQAKFYAAAPKSVPANGNFQLNYTLENANGNNLKLPGLSDFQLISGPNTSTSMQWINGNVSQSVTYSYVLRPRKEGNFKIGKASIQVSGVTMESNELSIEVTAPVAQQQNQQRQRSPFPYDPFENDPFFGGGQQREPEPEVSQEDLQKQLKDDVFVRLNISKNSVYKGEMFTATYKLYFRQNLSGFNVTKAPAFDGFWNQEIELNPNRKQQVETINGKQYYTVDILKYNLYPQRSGKLEVPLVEVSTVAQVAVRNRSRGFFDDFFGGGRAVQVPLTLRTNALGINVKDLPENGKPEDFTGAVGKYAFQASLSSPQTRTDDPVTYTVKVSGSGNLKFIDDPVLNLPGSFEVYDPKVKESITNNADGMSGSKQYDYLIIPRMPGDFRIEANTFSYFDPAQQKYVTLRAPEFSLRVTGEPSANLNDTSYTVSSRKANVAVTGQDIRYIKTQISEWNNPHEFWGSGSFWGLYTSPLLVFIALAALKRRNEKQDADIIGSKRRKALKVARKRLAKAEKHLIAQDNKNFYTEVSHSVWGYVSHKLNIEMSALSKENVEEKLIARQAKTETIEKLKALINTCELALYAPVGDGSAMKQNYETAADLIADLEDEIKS